MSESEKKHGIESLKKGVDFLVALDVAREKAFADGKISLSDAGLAVDPAFKLLAFAPSAGQAVPELGELDESEKAELIEYAKATHSLSDKKAEKVIERVFGAVVHLFDTVEDVASGDDDL